MTTTEKIPCRTCFGTGQSKVMRSPYPIRKNTPMWCSACNGTGFRPKQRPQPIKSRMSLVRWTRRGC